MDRTLNFIQIYFDDKHLPYLYDFSTPYKNESLTPYFENSVISELVPTLDADLISICSWRLKQKRGDCYRLVDKTLTKEKILNTDFDVAILTPRHPNHKPLLMASEWHGKAWDVAFEAFKPFLKQVGIKLPEELTYTVYENHFIATKEIYRQYVTEFLRPATSFMESRGEFNADSGYVEKKRRNPEEIKAYQNKSGRSDWPISTFVLERLFSIYLEGRGYKIVNL